MGPIIERKVDNMHKITFFGISLLVLALIVFIWIVLLILFSGQTSSAAVQDDTVSRKTFLSESIYRVYDPEYGVVCYKSYDGISCVKIEKGEKDGR